MPRGRGLHVLTAEQKEANRKEVMRKYRLANKERISEDKKDKYLKEIKERYCEAIKLKYRKKYSFQLEMTVRIYECDTPKEVRKLIMPYFTVEEYKNIFI